MSGEELDAWNEQTNWRNVTFKFYSNDSTLDENKSERNGALFKLRLIVGKLSLNYFHNNK